jgi:hypothetical protein
VVDRTRASDTERERVVEILRDAATHGRIAVEELAERSAAAYAAVTRSELAALIDDLPEAAQPPPRPRPEPTPGYRAPAPPPWVRPWPGLRPWLRGSQMFSARWRTPQDPREAARIIIYHVLPLLTDASYEVVRRSADEIVLDNESGDRVTIQMSSRRTHTETHIWGVAPRGVRQGLNVISK